MLTNRKENDDDANLLFEIRGLDSTKNGEIFEELFICININFLNLIFIYKRHANISKFYTSGTDL